MELSMPRSLAKLLLIVSATFTTSYSWCAEDEKPAVDLSTHSTDELVELLGSVTFESRETASQELARRGDSIRSELEAALRHPDLEVRLRARKLLAAMSHSDMQRRLEAFIEDIEGKKEHDLPAWKEYSKLLGSDKANRKLFAEMVTNEIDILRIFETDKKQVAAMLPGRILAFENGLIPGLAQQAPTASIATMLFLASDESVPLSTTLGYQLHRFLSQSAARKAIEGDAHSPLVKKLLVSWIERGMSSSSLARNGLLLAELYKLNDTALSLARKMVGQKNAASYTLPYAVMTIGRFGSKEDVAPVKTLLTNKAVCHTWHNGKFKKPIQIQVRDVALAILVHLTKQDHKEYGFDLLRPDPKGLYYVYTMGFPEDALREKALAKWQEWSEKQAS
jgi:hypothetical protein